ncbi:MAG: DUF1080 domain-containing protein [Planctomycetes bacterium]|nr:DUF1080 domain-containing protein [Planctomycetota bacterium]
MAAALAALSLLPAQESQPAVEEGFVLLFDGKGLQSWQMYATEKREGVPLGGRITVKIPFGVEEGNLVCRGGPEGILYTERAFRDFTFRFEWKYDKPLGLVKDESKWPGDSGVLLFVNEFDRVRPKSLAVEGSFREVGAIKPMGIKAAAKNDAEARKKARKPLAEWNETEIEVKGDKVTVRLNGTVVATATGLKTEPGRIALQNEGYEIRWRNLRIREEKP